MRVIICGAGIAGLTLAWWLRRDGWDVTLVEQASGPREDGYMMDFFGSGYDVAERMGLLPELARVHTRITELSYVDIVGRRTGGVRYPAMTEMMRGRVFSFMRGELERALRGAFDAAPDIRYGTSVAAVHTAAGAAVPAPSRLPHRVVPVRRPRPARGGQQPVRRGGRLYDPVGHFRLCGEGEFQA